MAFLGFMCLFCTFCFYLQFSAIKAINVTKEAALQAYLLKNYNKQVRPVLNENNTVNVSFSFEINQLLLVNDRAQYITIKAWVRQYWRNELLTWNPKDWNGIKEIKLPRTHVWIPDILLHNHAGYGASGGVLMYLTDIILDYTGLTSWVAPASFTSSCKFNMRNFPFDSQECHLIFSSWTEDISKINLQRSNVPFITSNYRDSAQWEIISVTSEIRMKKYDCCVHAFSDEKFTIKMKRKSLYFTFNVITPCIVLVINIFVGFFLPPDCGERVSLTITILLAVAVFLQLVSGSLPRNSDSIPILAVFYIVIMCESALSLISTCIVLIIYHHTTDANPKPVPGWLRTIFISFFAKALQVQRDNQKDNTIYYDHFQDEHEVYFNYEIFKDDDESSVKSVGRKSGFDRDPYFNMKADLLKEVQRIRALMLKRETTKEEEDLQEEWKYLAKVIDRFFFWLFFITILLTGICILIPPFLEQKEN